MIQTIISTVSNLESVCNIQILMNQFKSNVFIGNYSYSIHLIIQSLFDSIWINLNSHQLLQKELYMITWLHWILNSSQFPCFILPTTFITSFQSINWIHSFLIKIHSFVQSLYTLNSFHSHSIHSFGLICSNISQHNSSNSMLYSHSVHLEESWPTCQQRI